MQTYNCQKCGLFINESEKLWDELQSSGECPRCSMISAGLMTAEMGKPISRSEVKKYRSIIGLVFICLAILSLFFPISNLSGSKIGILNAIINITGPIGFSLILAIIGVWGVLSATRIK